jgi:NAD+ synthase (glutamine-hydrolysing)
MDNTAHGSPPSAPTCAPHRAGQKIRAWRAEKALTGEEFGALVAARVEGLARCPAQTVYNWEASGKVARAPIQRALIDMGVCEAADWLAPALDEAA